VKSKEEAIEWVKRCPNPMPGTEAEIEIRQVFGHEDFGAEFAPELREQEERLRAQAAQLPPKRGAGDADDPQASHAGLAAVRRGQRASHGASASSVESGRLQAVTEYRPRQ
jgi:hypothetical protein